MNRASALTGCVVLFLVACGSGGTVSDGGTGGGSTGSGGGASGTGGGMSGTGGGSASVTCVLTANVPTRLTAGTISGRGKIACTGVASLSLTSCLDYRGSSSAMWVEGVCQDISQSNVATLEVDAAVGCFSSTRDYRLRVVGSANGQALSEVESTPALMPACQ